MADRIIMDTDVLIDYLRGFTLAVTYLDDLIVNPAADLFVSTITVAELFAGVRNKKEQDKLDHLLLAFRIAPLDNDAAKKGGLLRRDWGHIHGTGLNDALIAATAESLAATLVTLNNRHYPMLQDVHIPYRKA